jgi:CheY-like chemotaxis protein
MKALTRRRILVVDDEASLTRLLKLNLEQEGDYEVRVEVDSSRALSVAREFRPDLVLLDLVMPHLSGYEVAEQLTADEELKGTPIVFITAVPNRQCVVENPRLPDLGPVIAKPSSIEQIVAILEERLGNVGVPVGRLGS